MQPPSPTKKPRWRTGTWKPQQIGSWVFSLRATFIILAWSSNHDAGEEEPGNEQALHVFSCHPLLTLHRLHPKAHATHTPGVYFSLPAWFMPHICGSPSGEDPITMSPCPPHSCPARLHFFLPGQPELSGGLCNSIGLQICLGSILILFKGQSIEPSLGFSKTEFHIVFNMR